MLASLNNMAADGARESNLRGGDGGGSSSSNNSNSAEATKLERLNTATVKQDALRQWLRAKGSVLVAFSGGVDSSYLAYIATQELGARAVCVTGVSPSLSAHEQKELAEFAAGFKLNHETIDTTETQNPAYQANNSNRCYFCKDELYTRLAPLAHRYQIAVIVDGSTTDDLRDHRPGRQAAAKRAVQSPLIEVGMSKQDVRLMSREANLPTWDKPASPCLSSRIAHGTPVTINRLRTVETGESILREFGFREFRVRHHDELVRLEIAPCELDKVLSREVVDALAARFRALGFRYVTLDLHGFRSGSLNQAAEEASTDKV